MCTSGTKSSHNSASFGNPGSAGFKTATLVGTGAQWRTDFGHGVGVYQAFFTKTGISQFALVSGDAHGGVNDIENNLIWAVYAPDYSGSKSTTGNEAVYTILRRIGVELESSIYQASAAHQNMEGDSVIQAQSPNMHELVGGSNGYSAKLVSGSSSNFGGTSVSGHADFFAVYGENFDSDHDVQALAFFDGNLGANNGKGDSWRGNSPSQTSWSYWGDDFHSNSAGQNIVRNKQTDPGANTYKGDMYLLAYG